MLKAVRNLRWLALALFGLGVLSGSACVVGAADFKGAGASFPASVYVSWGIAYRVRTGKVLDYQVAGSIGGQTQVLNGTVDFGASDVPMPAEALAAGKLLQFPAVIGAVVMIVNLDGVKSTGLKLTGPVIANIYLGNIAKWNDAAIKALNPDVTLPDLAIVPVHRSDPSGTTSIFTYYLSEIDNGWKEKAGAGTTVRWQTGPSAKLNDGMADAVQKTKGSIGYVEYVFGFAASAALTMPSLQNKSGKFLSPATAAFQAAAKAADWSDAQHVAASMINSASEDAWPMVSTTFVLLPLRPKETSRSLEVMKFFDWAFSGGDEIAQALHYVALPEAAKKRVREKWKAEFRGVAGFDME
ncbi:MAG: phosphate ABC transporter substrate-binding protein PstS [Rhodomicrobium sp.]